MKGTLAIIDGRIGTATVTVGPAVRLPELAPVAATAPAARPSLPPEPARVVIDVTIPGLALASEANARGKLGEKIGRKSAVKAAVASALPVLATPLALPVRVKIVRYGRAKLDEADNLPRACKAVVDVVAAWLGIDDADPRVRWQYTQRPGYAAGCRVVIQTLPGGHAR